MPLLTHVSSAAANTFSTGAINTIGANLLVVNVSYNVAPVVSDSVGNVWTALTVQTAAVASCQLYYVSNPITSAAHTFTATGVAIICCLQAAAFSSIKMTSPFDQQNGTNAGAAATLQPGAVVPTVNNELIVTSCGLSVETNPLTINSSFTIAEDNPLSGGVNVGGALAYLYQDPPAASVNPTWSSAAGTIQSAAIATFIVDTGNLFPVF